MSAAWEGLVTVANGVRLRARWDGPEDAPAVLLVNGLMMAIEAWQGLSDRLLPGHRVLRYDTRGQGGSDDPPGPHTIERHAHDLTTLLDALEPGPLHVVGLSSGAPIALLACAERARTAPGSLRSMTVCDGFLALDAHLGWVVRAWLAAHEAGGPGVRFDIATPWVWGQAFLAEHADGVAAWRAAALAGDATRAHHLIAGMAAFDGDAGPALDALACPVLALVGEDDVMTPPRHARAIAERSADGRMASVARAGHAAPIERPDAVAEALLAFWREVATSAASAPEPTAPEPTAPSGATRKEPDA